jgi:RNA ligase
MLFPRIEHLSDIEAHAVFEKGFVISRRPDHTVVDYVFTIDDTFSTVEHLECRGLKFDRDGRIIGRPFHKFFNIGERQQAGEIDWSAPHRVQAKLDGSMVHPVLLNGEMIFMTRMGATAQAKDAQREAGPALELCRHLLAAGITPIFEFTSPDNRIVVAYDRAQLTLLAGREMVSGAYLPHREIERLAATFGIATVADHGHVAHAADFIGRARTEPDIEGYVIAFDDGHRLKLKTEGYVLRHRALSSIHLEKNVLGLVCDNGIDDMIPLLPEQARPALLGYRDQVLREVEKWATRIEHFVGDNAHLTRKDFAMKCLSHFDRRLTGAVFSRLDGKDARQSLIGLLSSAAHSDPKIDGIRDLFGIRWSPAELGLPQMEN